MPKMNSMFPSKWLAAADLEDQDRTFTISDISQESVGQGEEQELKWVVFFREVGKGLVLNKTNATSLASCFGDDTDDWIGMRVVLYPTQVQFSGKMVEAIRVKEKQTKNLAKQGPSKVGAATSKKPATPITQADVDAARNDTSEPFDPTDDIDIPY